MASLDPETVQALDALLEDARANVQILVELANGATETAERETCTALGHAAVLQSCALHERLTTVGAPISRRVSGIVPQILETERYDDRLRAFARHQAGVCERAQALAQATEDRETRKVLHELYESGVRGALWCEQRATTFAASRLLLFGTQRAAASAAAGAATPSIELNPAEAASAAPTAPDISGAMQPQLPGPNGDGAAPVESPHKLPEENRQPYHDPPGHDGASSGDEH